MMTGELKPCLEEFLELASRLTESQRRTPGYP